MGRRLNGEGSIYFWEDRKKWVASVIVDGKKIIMTSNTSEEAPDNLMKLRRKYGLIKYSGDMTLSTWIDEWLFTVKSGSVSTKTLQAYQGLLTKYVKPYRIAKMKLSEIGKMDIVRLFNQLHQAGASKQIIGKVKTRLFSCFLDASDMIERNPVDGVKIPANAVDNVRSEEKSKAFTKSEQKALIHEIINPKNDFIQIVINFLILFGLGTGLRLGEMLALHYDRDFNDDFSEVYVKYNLQNMPIYTEKEITGYELKEVAPKSKAGVRTVPIPKTLQAKIRQHVLEIKKNSLRDPYFKSVGLLFPNELGNYMNKNRPQRHLRSLVNRLKLSSVNIHGLRHSYATRLLEAGENIQVISSLLGHSDTKVTMDVYAHVLDDLKKETAQKIDDILAL